MSSRARILYIEDDPGLSRLVRERLEAEGYRVDLRATGTEGLASFDETRHELVIIDYLLPDRDGLTILQALADRGASVPVIVVTGAGNEEIAVRAMKLGAADYINKDSEDKFFRLLPSVIERALRQHELERQAQRAQMELRESEERLRSVLASIDDAVLVVDKAGLFVAARAPRSDGRPATASEDWIGTTFRDAFPAGVAARFEAAFSAVQAGYRVEQFDYSLLSDGTEAWYNAKVSPLRGAGGSFAGVTIVARDITARKLAEDRLRLASIAADAANKAKSDLLAGMSHDLRTPLTAIIGYAEILSYEYFGTVNARQKQQLDVILQCSRHLLELINDILDISRIESGKTELELSRVRAESLLLGTIELLAESAGRRKIGVRSRISPDVQHLEIRVDERRIRQVLINLLSNALKFTPEEGTVEVSMSANDGTLQVSVQDSGIGIPRAELERIFDAFYQVKGRSSTSTESGSGLGLALARQIVELHGGRIWAESEGIGKGSRLTFTLPLGEHAPRDPVSSTTASS